MTATESFFDALKQHRESQNIEISEICDFTKINPKYIQAIESGEFQIFPTVYMRLFLRAYADFIGADSVKAGTYSVLLGLALVLVFIPVYYKLSGLIADFALIWNILLVLAVLASLGATLTLPGIAALILTVGMSVDANVIIFERIREELRKGKTPRTAIDSGYARALTTIIDANVTTLVAALVLYQFGTGPIKGFATVLFWGIMISMFTAIFVTRTIFNSFTERRGLNKLSI
jgi:protein-export membrane protein SecD